MAKISINQAQCGMVLADDVSNQNNVILLKQGTVLGEKHIKILKTWGIPHIEIEGENSETPFHEIIANHPEYLEEADQEADKKFLHVDKTHPFFEELIEIWKQSYVQEKARRS